MKDREFLKWIHDRLVKVHGENEGFDYMHKLRAVIAATDKEQETPNTVAFNTIAELEEAEQVDA